MMRISGSSKGRKLLLSELSKLPEDTDDLLEKFDRWEDLLASARRINEIGVRLWKKLSEGKIKEIDETKIVARSKRMRILLIEAERLSEGMYFLKISKIVNTRMKAQ